MSSIIKDEVVAIRKQRAIATILRQGELQDRLSAVVRLLKSEQDRLTKELRDITASSQRWLSSPENLGL